MNDDPKDRLILALTERVAAQAELLARKAEKPIVYTENPTEMKKRRNELFRELQEDNLRLAYGQFDGTYPMPENKTAGSKKVDK